MKKQKFILSVALTTVMTLGTVAAPVNYTQIANSQDVRQAIISRNNADNNNVAANPETNVTVESLDQPEFVRLSDGRLIPYGPGVMCSDACVESDVIAPHSNKKWLLAVPIIGGAIVAFTLLDGNDKNPVQRTIVSSDKQDPIPTTSPTPTPNTSPTPNPTPGDKQPEPVPEPGTITLLGAGLAMLTRKKVISWVKRDNK